MKSKKITVRKESVFIRNGEQAITLNKYPVQGIYIKVEFTFGVTEEIIQRIRNTGIAQVVSPATNHVYLSRKHFYTHEKMIEILTDIIDNYGNLQNQEQEKEKARAV